MIRFLALALVLGQGCLADKGPSLSVGASYGAPAPNTPTVKYGGPIVYSGEKPPIIHFPPPPAQVSYFLANLASCKDGIAFKL